MRRQSTSHSNGKARIFALPPRSRLQWRSKINIEDLYASYLRTGSTVHTAAEFGISHNTVCRILRDNGKKLNRPGKPACEKILKVDVDALYESYLRTGSTGRTAAEFGISSATVWKLLVKAKKALHSPITQVSTKVREIDSDVLYKSYLRMSLSNATGVIGMHAQRARKTRPSMPKLCGLGKGM